MSASRLSKERNSFWRKNSNLLFWNVRSICFGYSWCRDLLLRLNKFLGSLTKSRGSDHGTFAQICIEFKAIPWGYKRWIWFLISFYMSLQWLSELTFCLILENADEANVAVYSVVPCWYCLFLISRLPSLHELLQIYRISSFHILCHFYFCFHGRQKIITMRNFLSLLRSWANKNKWFFTSTMPIIQLSLTSGAASSSGSTGTNRFNRRCEKWRSHRGKSFGPSKAQSFWQLLSC